MYYLFCYSTRFAERREKIAGLFITIIWVFSFFPKKIVQILKHFSGIFFTEKTQLESVGCDIHIYLNHIHPLYACCCCYIYLYLLYHWDSSGYMRKICYCWANNTKLRLFSLSYWPGICLLYAIVSSQLILY